MTKDEYISATTSFTDDLFKHVCTHPDAVNVQCVDGNPIQVLVSVAADDEQYIRYNPGDILPCAQKILERWGEINGFPTVLEFA